MISVIVPVYNTEKYLDQCVASIVSQTYTDWECVLVDDGSRDGSGAICDKWASKEPRIKVVHQANSGVSCARNTGLDVATGEWVMFIDSDDYVDKCYLERFVDAKCADIVVAGLKMFNSDSVLTTFVPTCSVTYELDGENLHYFLELNAQNLLCGPVVKMYRMSIIRKENVRFPEDCHYGEDLLFNFSYLEYVDVVSQVHSTDYYYRYVDGSLSKKHRKERFEQDYEQWGVMKRFYEQRNLWNDMSKSMLYKRLWGIVYDGLFSTETSTKDILSVREIEEMSRYACVFDCASWIKWSIIHRMYIVFYIYRLVSRKTV